MATAKKEKKNKVLQILIFTFKIEINVAATTQNLYLNPLQAFVLEQLSYQDAKYPRQLSDLAGWQPDETQLVLSQMSHCCEPSESPPPINNGEAREDTSSSTKPM